MNTMGSPGNIPIKYFIPQQATKKLLKNNKRCKRGVSSETSRL